MSEIVCACGKHRWPAPLWHRWLKRLGLYRTAHVLYSLRYGFWAPGLFDVMDAYTTIHSIKNVEAIWKSWGYVPPAPPRWWEFGRRLNAFMVRNQFPERSEGQ